MEVLLRQDRIGEEWTHRPELVTENPKADHAYMDMGSKTKVLMH